MLGSWASTRVGGGARVLGRGACEAGAWPAAPGLWERLARAFATWAGPGKASTCYATIKDPFLGFVSLGPNIYKTK
jgi:hypothetical protein